MLSNEHLVVLSVQAEEFLLVVVGHGTDIDVWSLSQIAKPEQTGRRLPIDQIGTGWVFTGFHFKRVVLSWLLVVVHLNPGMVLLYRASRGKIRAASLLFQPVLFCVTMMSPSL